MRMMASKITLMYLQTVDGGLYLTASLSDSFPTPVVGVKQLSQSVT